jgi:hypothetical protein
MWKIFIKYLIFQRIAYVFYNKENEFPKRRITEQQVIHNFRVKALIRGTNCVNKMGVQAFPSLKLRLTVFKKVLNILII